MKRFIPQTMLGRTLAIVIGCIILVQAVGGVLHYREWREFSQNAERTKLIERIATYVQWVNAASPLQREFLLRGNKTLKMRSWLTRRPAIDDEEGWLGIEDLVRNRLAEMLGDINKKRIRVDEIFDRGDVKHEYDRSRHREHRKRGDRGDHEEWEHVERQMYKDSPYLGPKLLIAVRLDDGTWLNMRVPLLGFGGPPPGFMLSLFFMTLVVSVVAVLVMRRANKPLAMMAKAAEQLGRDVNAEPMKEEGPREVREAARAFNEMQRRLRRFVQDRTHMLAAISHDLRTPITRMKLRAEFVEDDQQRDKMLADLDEMEAMIAATMAFARDDVANESVSQIDLAALVESLCEDMRETGGDVSYEGLEEFSFSGRPIGLKRAVTNLVGNALKYGTTCVVKLETLDSRVILSVSDNGPGIPEDELEDVFRPFRRVEASRNKETGGVGLGLAVVRSVAHAHGGTAKLSNRPEGGLKAILSLPY